MINHLDPINIVMRDAIMEGLQTDIYQFIVLPEKDLILECVVRAHRVNTALKAHKAYKEAKGGEKET